MDGKQQRVKCYLEQQKTISCGQPGLPTSLKHMVYKRST